MGFKFRSLFLLVLPLLLSSGSLVEANQRSAGPQKSQNYQQQVQPNRLSPDQVRGMEDWGGSRTITPEQWSRRYSSIGTRRAPIEAQVRDRPVISAPTIDSDIRPSPESTYQGRRFFRRNGSGEEVPQFSTNRLAEQRTFDVHLPISQSLTNEDGEIDLDKVNRYTHRRNQPDQPKPPPASVQQAGGGN